MDNPNNNNPLRKRLYQTLLNQSPKQNNLLNKVNPGSKSGILRPKITQEHMNKTMKKSLSPVFQHGKFRIQPKKNKSPDMNKKLVSLIDQSKLSEQAKIKIQQIKSKSKQSMKPHDIFQLYIRFPQMCQQFFYLNKIGHSYQYQIIQHGKRNPNQYMTISSQGVTLYHGKQAQFMTKQQWLADQKVYYSLQKIQFFKQYKISKNFTIWKNRMRRHYMKQMSNLLSQSLFFSFQHPRNCLLEVRKITNTMKDTFYFMQSDIIASMSPQNFLQSVINYINKIFIIKLRQIQDAVSVQLQKAINEQIKKFKTQNNIKIQEVGDHDRNDSKQGYVYSQQAILRKQYKKVYKLIKLADNILLEAKIQLIEKCMKEFIEKMQQIRNQELKQEWITCTAFPVDQTDIQNSQQKKVIWNPTIQKLKEIFKKIFVQLVAKTSEYHQKISAQQIFQKYKVNEQTENRKQQKRNSLKYMVEQSSFYNNLLKKIQNYIQDQFSKTQKQQTQIVKFIDIYVKHKSLGPIKQIFQTNSASEYSQLVRQWKTDNQMMQKLPDNKNSGLLVFNYTELRKKILLAPSQSLSLFMNTLPQETSSKCRDLLHQSKILLQMIHAYPTDIQTFVSFNKNVRNASQRLDLLVDAGKQVIQMVSLMQENRLANLDIYKGRAKQTMTSINNLKAKVQQSNAKYDQSLSKFKKQLQNNIARVKNLVKDLISKFQVIPFDSIASQIPQILQKLNQILPTIQQLQKQSLVIQQIQNQLSLMASDFTQIHKIYSKSKVVHELWKCKKDWNDLLFQIFNRHYSQIDCEQIKNKWQQFSSLCSSMQKQLHDNQVLKKLNSQINQFQNLIQTIIALTSKNLQQKSWKQIAQYLAYQLNIQEGNKLPFANKQDPQYTVEWLIKNNISLYKQKIIFIVQKSQKQKELQASLGQFKTFISSIVFQIVIKKRQVILIEANLNLKENLREKLNILYALIGNQYSDILKLQAETLIKQYQYIQEILTFLYQFRYDWQKYQPFFQTTSASIKLLSKQFKEFSSWQLQWKKIIKNITNDPVYFYKKVCDQTWGINCSRGMIKTILKANTLLDMVKKGFQQFMEKKRIQFPRYCLFTDQQLFSILSKIDNRQLVSQQLIPILYDNLKSIQYEEQSGYILSTTTKNNDKFILLKQSTIKSQSEMQDLLKIAQQQIKKTMNQVIRTNFNKYIQEQITRQYLIKNNLLQVLLCIDYIAWVRLAEETYLVTDPIGTIYDWLGIQNAQIKELTTMIHIQPLKMKQKLIQFMAHCLYLKQKTQQFAHNKVQTIQSYEWQRIPKMVMSSNQIYLKILEDKIFYNFQLLKHSQMIVITAQTQKVWLNISNAISNKLLIGLTGSHNQTLKDLGFYVGQSIKQIKISLNCNLKTFERLLTGYLFIGSWLYFKQSLTPQILSYLSYHINSSKRSLNENNSNLQMTKTSILSNSLANTVFLFEGGQVFVQKNLIQSKNFRNIYLIKPNQQHIFNILCKSEQISPQIGKRFLNIITLCKQIFNFKEIFTNQFILNIFNFIKNNILDKFSHEQILDHQILDYIILSIVEQNINSYQNQSDFELFQSLKLSILPNFTILKTKHNKKLLKSTDGEYIHPVQKYLKNKFKQTQPYYSKQYINQISKGYDILNDKTKIGIIVTGNILNGKSNLIKLIQQAYKFQLLTNNQNPNQFKTYKIYPNSYKLEDVIKVYSHQKKQKKSEKSDKNQKSQKQKTDKINQDFGILQSFLSQQTKSKWIIFDGMIHKQFLQLINQKYQSILLPNYGILSKQKYKIQQLQKVKFIIQSLNYSQFDPTIYYNYGICHVPNNSLSVDCLVKSFFQKQDIKKCTKSFTNQSINYLMQHLTLNLIKVQQKGSIKNKQIDFIYPLNDNQITLKVLNIIKCVFKMNLQSIRQKEKNMKKTIQKFIYWAILLTLNLHVQNQSQSKLQKKFTEICKCDGVFNDIITKYIVYPGSGIQVHLVNGLRTQSSLFEIPEKGIITRTPKNDFHDFNIASQKNSKFYQQIPLQQVSSIRVNYEESNSFSYFAQLYAYANRAVVIYGAPGTGKKSILDLYAKNIKNKAQLHSIRFNKNKSLIELYEKPFRKFSSLKGVVLKSFSPQRNIVIFIQDVSMTKKQFQNLEFIRMLSNEQSFINKNGHIRRLTEMNNSLVLSSNRIAIQENVLRLVTKLTFFQTTQPTAQKINSIFLPYLTTWSQSNNLQGEISRIFSSTNGDNILDATIKVFQFMQENYIIKKSQEQYNLNTILLKPRIGDISKVLSFICRTQQANTFPITYYSQLWASQILRVFGDRIHQNDKQLKNQLIQLIKKEFFLKFKQNFVLTPKDPLLFTNILSQENKFYQRVQDIDHLQQFIINLIQCQTVDLPVKLFFNQLIIQVIKIYRIIEIENGHIIVLDLNKKVRQYLIELACQIAESNYIPLKQKLISAEKDILLTLDKDQNVCIFQDIDDITNDQIYQFTCLLNQNFYEFQMKSEIKQKIKTRLSKYLKNIFSQLTANKQSSPHAPKQKIQAQKDKQNLYLAQKLEEDFQITMQQVFLNNVHFIFGASPTNQKTKRFLLNQSDLVGQFHYTFFYIPQESLHQITKQILNEQVQNQNQNQSQIITQKQKKQKSQYTQKIFKKVIVIYNSMSEQQRDYNSLLFICQNIMTELDKLIQQSNQRMSGWQKCLINSKKALQIISQNQEKLKLYLQAFDQIKSQQFQLSKLLQQKSNEISQLQLNSQSLQNCNNNQYEAKQQLIRNKNLQFQSIQQKIREVKLKKDKNQLDSRQSRKIISVAKDYIQIAGQVQDIQNKIITEKKQKQKVQNLLILWLYIVLFDNKKSTQEIIADFNKWMLLLDSSQNSMKFQTSYSLLNQFQSIIYPLNKHIPNLQFINENQKLKIIILLYTLSHQEQTIFSGRILTIYDPNQSLQNIFKNITNDDQVFGQFKFGLKIQKYDQNFWANIQKCKKGIIFLGSSIQLRQKKQIQKILEQRRILNVNRFVSIQKYQNKSDYVFKIDKLQFKNYLIQNCASNSPNYNAKIISNQSIQYGVANKKIKSIKSSFIKKCSQFNFISQNDSTQLFKIKKQIQQNDKKINQINQKKRLIQIQQKDQQIIQKIIECLFEKIKNKEQLTVQKIIKLYEIIKNDIQQLIHQMTIDKKDQIKGQVCSPNEQKTQNKQISQNKLIGYNEQELKCIFELIQKIISLNFTNIITEAIKQTPQISNIYSLQLSSKLPIIILPNNLSISNFITKQNRPLNLLQSNNFSNLLLETTEQKINHKYILFYNDSVHYYMLMDLVKKYVQEYQINQKKYYIYLLTNSKIDKLKEKQSNEYSKYKIFEYEQKLQNQNILENQSNILNQYLQQIKQNQDRFKIYLAIKLIEFIQKIKFNFQSSYLQEIIKYAENLKNSNQKKLFLNDILTFNSAIDHKPILERIFDNVITEEEILNFMNNKQRISVQCLNLIQQKPDFIKTETFNKQLIVQLNDQIPNPFNYAQFATIHNKDPIIVQIQSMVQSFNKKLKSIKKILQNNLDQHTLKTNDKNFDGKYEIPSKQYIQRLNKQYKNIKKNLSVVGLLTLPSISNAKIASNKGIFESNMNLKNTINYQQKIITNRLINQIKIRASKRLKVPFKRIGLAWSIERKSDSLMSNIDRFLIQNLIPEISLITTVYMKNGNFLGQKSQKSFKLIKNINVKLHYKGDEQIFRIYLVPFDINNQNLPLQLSTTNQVQKHQKNHPSHHNSHLNPNITLNKKQMSLLNQIKKQQKQQKQKNYQMIKLKIINQQNLISNVQQRQNIGQLQLFLHQISIDNINICHPQIIILNCNK